MKGYLIPAMPILVIAAAACIAFGALHAPLLGSRVSFTAFQHTPLTTYAQEKAHWEDRIREIGGPAAYKEFSASMQKIDLQRAHDHAHAFGEALYEVEGMKGVSVCDLQFNLGCIHTFFGRAVADLGIPKLADINTSCSDAPMPKSLFCHHGIGHGLMAYFGYSEADLKQVLSLCDGLPNDPLKGCDIGAFMEYSQQSMLGSSAQIRTVTGGDWNLPCDAVDARDQQVCYFYQPQWWSVVLEFEHVTGVDAFKKMGALCEALPSKDLAIRCFEGLGHMTPFNITVDESVVTSLCNATSENKDYALDCRYYAASTFFLEGLPDKAKDMCTGLQGDPADLCMRFATTADPSKVPNLLGGLPI